MEPGHFWDTLSQQLEKKGQDYAERCALRETLFDSGGDIILPESFPKLPVQELQESTGSVKVSEDDLKKVRANLLSSLCPFVLTLLMCRSIPCLCMSAKSVLQFIDLHPWPASGDLSFCHR